MKIAILGNMNNNGFALMRYFRDLGADAHLLPFANDSIGSLAHFAPEADSWEMEKWRSYIHPTGLMNWPSCVLPDPRRGKWFPSSSGVARQLAPYDRIVGSGAAPAIMDLIGRRLAIFFPYAIGVEWIEDPDCRMHRNSSRLKKLAFSYLRMRQARGIRNAQYCLNADMAYTADVLRQIGRPFQRVPIPMVYNREGLDPPPGAISEALRHVRDDAGFKVFTAARQHWVLDGSRDESSWNAENKHNEYLFRGLAAFLKNDSRANIRLYCIEYGKDVDASKALCAELGIAGHVTWLPRMRRKELAYCLSRCDVAVGEFIDEPGTIWGGTGWEALAAGRPLIQGVNFAPGEFQRIFGYAPPAIMDVKSAVDVARHILALYRDRADCAAQGVASRAWFDRHNGITLAQKWLDLLLA